MTLKLFFGAIVAWVFYSALKFYRNMNWNEPAESSPDFQAMRKREAELMHIQEVLETAQREGKLSASLLQEYNRFYQDEIEAMKGVETAWKTRRRTPNSGGAVN